MTEHNSDSITTEPLPKVIDKFFGKFRAFSNFYIYSVIYDGVVYPSNENAFQAAKTKDLALRIPFQKYTSSEAKRNGAKDKLVLRNDWEDIRLSVMREINTTKFTTSAYLKSVLLSTDGIELIEGNYWHDNFWGICYCRKCPKKGENNLGKILMEIRQELLTNK